MGHRGLDVLLGAALRSEYPTGASDQTVTGETGVGHSPEHVVAFSFLVIDMIVLLVGILASGVLKFFRA